MPPAGRSEFGAPRARGTDAESCKKQSRAPLSRRLPDCGLEVRTGPETDRVVGAWKCFLLPMIGFHA